MENHIGCMAIRQQSWFSFPRSELDPRAIGALQKLLSMPGQVALTENVPFTPALLRLDPMFDRLRYDPRLQKLVA
jgi:hypothetical protein